MTKKSDTTILGGVGDEEATLAQRSYEELLANPPTNVRRKQPLALPVPKPKPQMHAAVAVAERGLRQSAEQLRAAHVAEMRVVSKAYCEVVFARYYHHAGPPAPDDGEETLKRMRTLAAYWREVARFAEATANELWEVYLQTHRQSLEEEKEWWEKTKEERAKNGWRWAVESTADLRRALAWEAKEEPK